MIKRALVIAGKRTWQEKGYTLQIQQLVGGLKELIQQRKLIKRCFFYLKLPSYLIGALLIATRRTWQDNGYTQQVQKLKRLPHKLILLSQHYLKAAKEHIRQAIKQQATSGSNQLRKARQQRLTEQISTTISIRRSISKVLLVCILVSMLSPTFGGENLVYGANAWDGTFPTANTVYAFSGGDGTTQTPYLISTLADLAQLSSNVNSGITYGGIFFKVTNNLVMNDGVFNENGEFTKTGDSSTSSALEWKPIGTTEYKFKGIFDGDNHTISGMYINKSTTTAIGSYLGLFGFIQNSTIKNIGLTDGYISGYNYVGAIVGSASAGTVNESILIQNCYNTGTVKGNLDFGGIIGYLSVYNGTGMIEKCYNTGSISGNLAAGVIGKATESGNPGGTIIVRYCYNSGEITSSNSYIGGVIGFNIVSEGIARVEYCYNTGNMNTIIKNASHAGGIMNENWCYGTGYATLANSYSTGSASYGDGVIGALATKWWNTGWSGCRQPIIVSTYYDVKMSPRATTADNGVAITSMSGLSMQGNSSFADDTKWIFTEGLYPRLAGMEDTDAALVSAVPVFLATGDSAASVTKDITLGQAQGVTWTSSNTNIISISDNSIGTVSRPSVDTTVRLTASKNGISRVVELTVQAPPLITGIIKTTVDTLGTSYEGDSLELIIGGTTKTAITSIEITGGIVTSTDWGYLYTNKAAFTNLTNFKVADTITSVANIAGTTTIFPTAKLETIYIAKVASIGDKMFYNTTALKTVSLPDTVNIGSSSFFDGALTSKLTTVYLPKVISVGADTFRNNKNLVTVDIASATSIGNYAFYGCTSLTAITASKVITLGTNAFENCAKLTAINMPLLTEISDYAFSGNSSLASADFPKVLKVNQYAFKGCTSLQAAVFPKLQTINQGAFENCTSFSAIRLGSTPPAIQYNSAFNNNPTGGVITFVDADNLALTGAALLTAQRNYGLVSDLPNRSDLLWYGWDAGKQAPVTAKVKTTKNPEGIVVGSTSLFIIMLDTSLNTSLTSIEVSSGVITAQDWINLNGQYKSQIFAALEEFNIADTVTSVATIPDGMFNYNTTLKSVNMAKLTSIGQYPFAHCSKLTSAIFPDATTVGNQAFLGSTSLASISLPLATSLGTSVFNGCKSLLSLELPVANTMGISTFEGCSQLTTVTLPAITLIPARTFINCTSLTDLALPEVLTIADGTYYSDGSFSGCNSLTNLNLPKATKIGDYAFYGNTAISTVITPKVTILGRNTFYTCTSLSSIEMDKVTSMGMAVFAGCSKLATVDFPQFASTIPTYAFQNCASLASISLPKAIGVDDYAFDGCASLVDIEFPLVTIIGTNPSTLSLVFRNCTGLQTVNFPVALTIQPYAFQGCTSLTTATFPKLTNIKEGSFKGCNNFASLKLPATPPYVALNWSNQIFGIILDEGTVNRQLTFVDASGADLTGAALTSAQVTYKAVNASDGHIILRNTTDNLWFNWSIAAGEISTIALTSVTISGTAQVGQTLTASIAPSGATASYQWKAGSSIVGTGASYVVKTADLDKTITVVIIGTGIYTGTVTSAATNSVIAAPIVTKTGVFGAKFSQNQLFDVQRSPAFPTIGKNFRLSGMKAAYTQNFPTTISWATGDYVKFEYVSTVSEAGVTTQNAIINSLNWYYKDAEKIKNAALVKEIQYTSTGSIKAIISDFGLIWAIDSEEGFLYTALNGAFKSSGGLGTFVSFTSYVYGSSTSYLPDSSDPLAKTSIEAKTSVAAINGDLAEDNQDAKFDISGKIVKEDGTTPIGGVEIIITYPTGATNLYSDITDDDGYFKIPVPIKPADVLDVADYLITIKEPDKDPVSSIIKTSGGGIGGFGTDDITSSGGVDSGYLDDSEMIIINYPPSLDGPGGIRVIAPEVVSNYSLSFNTNGGAAIPTITIAYGETIILPTATKTGLSFIGWYTDSQLTTPCALSTMGAVNITLYAKWEIKTYTVGGSVTDVNGNVSGASIKLMSGNRLIAQATSNDSGVFNISGVSSGNYNLVISDGVSKIITLMLAVYNDVATGSIQLPSGNKNSVVEVKANAPDILVDKLNDFFASSDFTTTDSSIVNEGGTVEIKLTVELKQEGAANAESILAAAGHSRTIGMFLELNISKIVTASGSSIQEITAIEELDQLLTIDIPLTESQQGKENYLVYRYHGGAVETLTATANGNGEYLEVSADGKSIRLYVKMFSTYAISFSGTSTPSSPIAMDWHTSSEPIIAVDETSDMSGGVVTIGADKKTITIIPAAGYLIADLLVDGKSVGASTSFVLQDSNSHKISAIFVKLGTIPYYLRDDKRYYIGFSVVAGKSLKFTAPIGVTVLFEQKIKGYTDTAKHWAKDNIDFVAQRDIFVTETSEFKPNIGITRAEFITLLGKLYENSYGIIKGESEFSDLAIDASYGKYVGWAYTSKLIQGNGKGEFIPNKQISREEMAKIIYDFAKFLAKAPQVAWMIKLNYVDNATISQWALESTIYCQLTGIMNGRTDGNFAPKDNATRAEAAAVLERFIEDVMK
ncbi:MAG: leucine-rich repeat protein [Clostridia bacterium]